jgi:hypothetical protein
MVVVVVVVGTGTGRKETTPAIVRTHASRADQACQRTNVDDSPFCFANKGDVVLAHADQPKHVD